MGKQNRPSHKIEEFTPIRQVVVDYLNESAKKNTVYGIFECDVTKARNLLREMKEEKEKSYSFAAFIMICLAKALDDHKIMQAYRDGKKKLVIFDDVDVVTVVERTINGKNIAGPYIVRGANKKSIEEITNELRSAKNIESDGIDMNKENIGNGRNKKKKSEGLDIMIKLPRFLRKIIFHKILHNPFQKKKIYGTVGLTSVGMFAPGKGGWGLPITPHALSLALGGIAKKPAVVEDDKIEVREFLSVTLAIDHDIVDGSPATRFLVDFNNNVESAYGLE